MLQPLRPSSLVSGDDGNAQDGDGCSSDCGLEKHFVCFGGSVNTSSSASSRPSSSERVVPEERNRASARWSEGQSSIDLSRAVSFLLRCRIVAGGAHLGYTWDDEAVCV